MFILLWPKPKLFVHRWHFEFTWEVVAASIGSYSALWMFVTYNAARATACVLTIILWKDMAQIIDIHLTQTMDTHTFKFTHSFSSTDIVSSPVIVTEVYSFALMCPHTEAHVTIGYVASALIICYTTLILKFSSSVQPIPFGTCDMKSFLALRGFYVEICHVTV